MKDFPLLRRPKTAVISTLIIILPLLLLSSTALGGVYAAMLVLLFLPVAACVAGAMGGMLPLLLSTAVGLMAMHQVGGSRGLILAAVYLLPLVAGFVAMIAFRVPFRSACFALIGLHVAALAGCYLLLQGWTGGNLYLEAGRAAMAGIENWELGDDMLFQLYSMGLIDLPDTLQGTAIVRTLGGYALSSEARQDLLLSLNTLVSRMLETSVPSLLVSQSILGGVACLLLPIRLGAIEAERWAFLSPETGAAAAGFPDLGMPKFETWHLPRGIGWQVGLALAAGYVLRVMGDGAVGMAGIILYSAAHTIFVIQGAALLNFVQKSRGTRRFWRILVPIVLMLLSVLAFLGIFDQISNIRRLRKPRDQKEDMDP